MSTHRAPTDPPPSDPAQPSDPAPSRIEPETDATEMISVQARGGLPVAATPGLPGHPDPWETPGSPGHPEPQVSGYGERLNRLRAGVLGANDGIISVAATVVGVAGATADRGAIALVAAAALSAGALSMALGEYVSVSSQSDSQNALIEKERAELEHMPEAELAELAGLLEEKGLSRATAMAAAVEMTRDDALRAHLDVELGIAEEDIPSPVGAAVSSGLAFTIGALLPVLAILLPPAGLAVPATFVAVLFALALTGWLGARLGGSPHRLRAAARLVLGGALALAATFLIGRLIGG